MQNTKNCDTVVGIYLFNYLFMFTFKLGAYIRNGVHIVYMSDMMQAAKESMGQKEPQMPDTAKLVEEVAKLPDAPESLKNDVDAIHKYAREQLSAASDDVTKINALADLDRDETVESEVKNIVNEDKLKSALDRAMKDGTSLDTIYKNVTGNTANWSPE